MNKPIDNDLFAKLPSSLAERTRNVARDDVALFAQEFHHGLCVAMGSKNGKIWSETLEKYQDEQSVTVRIKCLKKTLKRIAEVKDMDSIPVRHIAITALHYAFNDAFSLLSKPRQ